MRGTVPGWYYEEKRHTLEAFQQTDRKEQIAEEQILNFDPNCEDQVYFFAWPRCKRMTQGHF